MIWPFDQVRTTQPQGAVGIAWSNPLTRGMQFAITPLGILGAATPKTPSSSGIAFTFNPAVSTPIATGVASPSVSSHSAFLLARHTSMSLVRAPFYLTNRVSANNGWGFYTYASSGSFPSQTLKLAYVHGGIAAYQGTVSVPGANTTFLPVGFSAKVSSTVDFYASGAFVESLAIGSITQSTDAIQIGADVFFAGGFADCDTPLIAYWNRSLSAQEHASLAANPWQLFAKRSNPIFVGLGPPAITAYYPGSDISVAGWTSSTGSGLYADIDDVVLNRLDYITSPDLSTTATFGWKDSNGNPATIPAGTWNVDLDAAYFLGASGQVRLVWLDAGGSSVGATSWQTLTSTDATYTLSITTTGPSTQFRYEDGP